MARNCILRTFGLQIRCHDVFLWCYVCFVLFRFLIYAFVEAVAFRSIVFRYAGAPIATRVSFFFSPLYIWTCRFFRVFFVPLPFCHCMESTSYVISFRVVFFYLVTTGWIFYINLYENSINQSNRVHLNSFMLHRQKAVTFTCDNYVSGIQSSALSILAEWWFSRFQTGGS